MEKMMIEKIKNRIMNELPGWNDHDPEDLEVTELRSTKHGAALYSVQYSADIRYVTEGEAGELIDHGEDYPEETWPARWAREERENGS